MEGVLAAAVTVVAPPCYVAKFGAASGAAGVEAEERCEAGLWFLVVAGLVFAFWAEARTVRYRKFRWQPSINIIQSCPHAEKYSAPSTSVGGAFCCLGNMGGWMILSRCVGLLRSVQRWPAHPAAR